MSLTIINPFLPNVRFLYPLKMSENHWFSDVSRGIEIEHCAKMGKKQCQKTLSTEKRYLPP